MNCELDLEKVFCFGIHYMIFTEYRDSKAGQTIQADPLVKNARHAQFFNPLTRSSLSCINPFISYSSFILTSLHTLGFLPSSHSAVASSTHTHARSLTPLCLQCRHTNVWSRDKPPLSWRTAVAPLCREKRLSIMWWMQTGLQTHGLTLMRNETKNPTYVN